MLKAASLSGSLSLRAATPNDHVFMRQLFESTREHLRRLSLHQAQVEILMDQQYRLQQASYARQWPNAAFLVIEHSGQAIGRLVLDDDGVRFHVVDVALLPATRGKGHGTALLRGLQVLAADTNRSIDLSVDRHNLPAKRLYHRLGFRHTGETATQEFLTWSTTSAETSPEAHDFDQTKSEE